MLESFASSHANSHAVLTVNIDKWSSPVARQYQIHGIPCFIVFDATGKKQAEGKEARDLVMKLLPQGRRQPVR